MPQKHVVVFPVRSYECDTYGHVNQTQYLRYMQEAAFQASAAVGYDPARYAALNTTWMIRELQIEYQHALLYGDSIEVTTWVEDFRRVRSRRIYELKKTSGEPVARAAVDWVYLDRSTSMPVHVPPEMVTAFAPDEADRVAGERRPAFPTLPPTPPGAYTMERQVEWRDVDQARHVNNANILAYMEECSVRAAAVRGWPVSRMEAQGFGIMARSHHIEYRQQAALGDALRVTTFLAEPRRSTVYRIYSVRRAEDDALVAQSRSQFMCVNVQTGGLMRFPDFFVAEFADSIAEAPAHE